jgi:superfamily II DNA/RNA helicase
LTILRSSGCFAAAPLRLIPDRTLMPFADLGLSDPLLRAVAEAGYDEPTPIQKGTIPPVLMGKDIIGIAQTGTGKTAAFVLPMIDILGEGRSRARMPRSLILEPTRELAAQVAENFEKYGKYHKLSMALLIGGVQMGDQVKALEKGVDVLIATPGRLMDLYGRGKILLTGCSLLVIDEADRMLDMGFIPDIEEICSRLPKSRQTLLFSATMPPPIKKLADKFLTDPKVLEVSRPASANLNIEQRIITTTSAKKRDVLMGVLRHDEVKNAIIFSNRKTTVRDLFTSLRKSGFKVGQIHGDMEQAERIAEFDRFKDGSITILVASDVAARGLDVKGVSHVINFDVPWQPDDYVHRIGRTGRAGLTGIAITLATKEDAEAVAAIEKLTATKIARFSGDGTSEGAAAVVPASEEAPREKRQRTPRAKAAPKAAPAPKAEAPAERAPRAEEPRRERAPRQERPHREEPRREEPRREQPRYEREEAPAAEPKLAADANPDWNGPMPSFLSFGAS